MAPQSLKELKKTAAASSSSKAAGDRSSTSSLSSAVETLTSSYARSTPAKVKLIDSFLLFFALSGVAQMAYYLGVTAFPYNAFLGGFASTAGQFVLLASLRAQVVSNLAAAGVLSSPSPSAPAASLGVGSRVGGTETAEEFAGLSSQRAFAEFCFASVILHWFAFNFLG